MAVHVLSRRPGAAYRPVVRVVSALSALGIMLLYSLSRVKPGPDSLSVNSPVQDTTSVLLGKDGSRPLSRHLLSSSPSYYDDSYWEVGDNDGSGGGDEDSNCTSPRKRHGYNTSCDYVLNVCGDQAQLFDYLRFILCGFPVHLQWVGYIMLALWLLYLISLLATTADNFFVPPLNLLSEKLQLSPSIAGITLLAIGNGAPDVFTAYAGLKQDDIELVLGALIGASIFISTVVLGTIILVVKIKPGDVDKIDFVRDVTAYLLVVALVVGVAYDGDVKLFEAVLFLLFYILYITCAVTISYLRGFYEKMKQRRVLVVEGAETDPLLGLGGQYTPIQASVIREETDVKKEVEAIMKGDEEVVLGVHRVELAGLTWPRGANIASLSQFIVEWPMSILRWASVPPCCYDGHWSRWHYLFTVISPIPMVTIMLVTVSGWSGFYDVWAGKLPIYVLLIICVFPLSVLFFVFLSSNRPPHWTLQILLGTLAFIMSIAWLNIEANEVVAVLDAFGLLFNIDTGILGLTVLAIGNSVGDWVADTAVARAGKPGMGIASCFGSPLLNDVLGLSIALIAKIGFYNHGRSYTFDIHGDNFLKVKMSWVFLGISLVSSIIVIPLFKFVPPKPFGAALIYLYLVFMVFSILDETGHLNINFLR